MCRVYKEDESRNRIKSVDLLGEKRIALLNLIDFATNYLEQEVKLIFNACEVNSVSAN